MTEHVVRSYSGEIGYPKFIWLQYTIAIQMILGVTTAALAVITLMTLKRKTEYENALILYDVALIFASAVGLYSLKSRK